MQESKGKEKNTPVKTSDYKVAEKSLANSDTDYIFVNSKPERVKLINYLATQKVFAFDTETTSLDTHQAELVGLAFSCKKGEAYYVPIPEEQEKAKTIVLEFKELLEQENTTKVGQNIKFDVNILKWYDVRVRGVYFDTMIAHYLLEPDLRHKLDYLSVSYLGYKMVPIESLIGKRGVNQLNMRDIQPEQVKDYAAEDADITFQLKEYFAPLLKEQELTNLFEQLEMPLVKVLSDMEMKALK